MFGIREVCKIYSYFLLQQLRHYESNENFPEICQKYFFRRHSSDIITYVFTLFASYIGYPFLG